MKVFMSFIVALTACFLITLSAFAQQAGNVPPPAQTAPSYFYADNSQQVGPVPFNQIQQLIGSGKIGRTTLVWTKGMAQWAPAGQVPQLAALMSTQPVQPPQIPQTDWKAYMAGTWVFEVQKNQYGMNVFTRSTQSFLPDGRWVGVYEVTASRQGLQTPTQTNQAQGTWEVLAVHGDTFTLSVTSNQQKNVNKMKRLGPNRVRNESGGFEAQRMNQ